MQDLKEVNKRTLVALTFPYILFFLFFNRFFFLMDRVSIGFAFKNLKMCFNTEIPLIPLGRFTLYAFAASVLIRVIAWQKAQNAKKFRKGEEYGSAKWADYKDIKPYINSSEPDDNIILTKTESLTMEERMPSNKKKYERNKNVLVIGGSGSGKTRFYVKPNIMQQHSSYVITDPKGSLLTETGRMLAFGKVVETKDKQGKKKVVREAYQIKVFNTINFKKSMHYNPFAYVKTEKDILKLVNTLMINTKGEGSHSGDEFWVKAERLLYCALIAYIVFELETKDRHFGTLVDMIDNSQVSEEDESYKNIVDVMFEELEERKRDCFAVRQYNKYKLAAGKTAKSILISCGARLAPFDMDELKEIMSFDDLELDKIGDRKTALFIIVSDTDTTFNFVVAMLYSQLFNLLCERADDKYNGKLPVHVRCLLDEFANIGQIPNFEKLIATIRSRRISASVILQTQSQLKDLYKEKADTIVGNCDTTLFLGGKEKTTSKEMEELLGKETIDLFNDSENRGREKTYGMSYQKTGRSLMTQDEVAVMDGGKCILQIRGSRPFLSEKYDLLSHKRYKQLSDYNDEYAFDVEKFLYLRSKGYLKRKTMISERVMSSYINRMKREEGTDEEKTA
ncbi:VirD4-like conjugal transfer protein, CD1115 family [Aedoeadaptatus acetigenes]|uniref:VirD4-like conjugal transfer protein, CD1115 family n=1 Tax=Aedoeadaptatus acetigenes TaxID=2981723 RepID=UPI003D725004